MIDWTGPKTHVKALRKAAKCTKCLTLIMPGEPASRRVGVYEGDFYCLHSHAGCDEFVVWLAKARRCWGDEFPFLHDLDWDEFTDQERQTVKERWPRLYERYLAKYEEASQ